MARREPVSRERFRSNDAYRAEREWLRLEGTAQRDLFRELRARFLSRHAGPGAWALDAGSGPGRFTAGVGRPGARRIAADVARSALEEIPRHWRSSPVRPLPDRVLTDLADPPFPPAAFGTVAALGNLLGFAEGESDAVRERLSELLGPGGVLVLEIAPGPGERSRYLRRLPAGSVARLLRAPVRAVLGRVVAEGFAPVPARRASPGAFRRIDPGELALWCESRGLSVREIVAVAPTLGPDAARIDAVARDPVAWDRLLEVEESVGRNPERWPGAAAVLVAAERKSEA